MPDHIEPPGGQGDDPPSRSDCKLYEQALRNDWPIPTKVKLRILQRLVNLIDVDPDDEATRADPDPDDEAPMLPPAGGVTARTTIAAARVVAAFCNLSLKQQALDLARKRVEGDPDKITLDQLTREAEERAERRIDERAADEPAQPMPR